MPVRPSDIPNLLKSGIRTEFMAGYGATPTIYDQFTLAVNSTKSSEDYAWLGSTPKAREFISERQSRALREYAYSLKNKKYEATIEVDEDAIDDDQYGQVNIRARQLGEEGQRYKDELATGVVENATGLAYDGQYFFDTDHVDPGAEYTTQQSNKFIGGSYAFGATAAKAIITAGTKTRLDTGKIANVRFTHVMVPTDLEWSADEIFNPTNIRGVTTDPAKAQLAGKVKIIVNPYLTNNGANSRYYFLDLSKTIKPFIYQNRLDVKFEIDETQRFKTSKIFYGIKFRCAFGYGDWRLAAVGGGA